MLVGPGDVVAVEVAVSNAGERVGSEPVELFVRDERSSRVTSVRALAGITRIELDAGERGIARFEHPVAELGVIDDGRRTGEPGVFTVTLEYFAAEFEDRKIN